MGGFWSDSVPEETLSRDEANRVLRRLVRMLRPLPRPRSSLATFVLMAQAARAARPGPLLVRYGIDHGHRGDAATPAR